MRQIDIIMATEKTPNFSTKGFMRSRPTRSLDSKICPAKILHPSPRCKESTYDTSLVTFLRIQPAASSKQMLQSSEITRSIRASVFPRQHVYDKWCVQEVQHGGRDEVQRQADVSCCRKGKTLQLMRTMLHESHAIYNSDELSHGFPANVLLGDI